MKKPELLAPAGNLEKLKVALEFGADAVYFGLPDFSLRARVNQFDQVSIGQGASICREKGKKFYVTLNIYAHNSHLEKLPEYFDFLKKLNPDGLIISDPGILQMAKRYAPKIPLHLSTQANTTNIEAAKFWQVQGIKRIIAARELALEELRQIKASVLGLELECFIHGAMCMSYSGRCILSKWMSYRSANLGDCAQPCRWKYRLKDQRIDDEDFGHSNNLDIRPEQLIVTAEDDRGKFSLEIQEDRHGTYIFNSHDICLIGSLESLVNAGIDSFKIEGRSKSVYYLAVVTKAYRTMIDAISQGVGQAELQSIIKGQMHELAKLSHRGYSRGFLLGEEPPHLFDKDANKSDWMFCGISGDSQGSVVRLVTVHNYVKKGEEVEIITPKELKKMKIMDIRDADDRQVESAHGGGGEPYKMEFSGLISGTFLMRKQNKLNIP